MRAVGMDVHLERDPLVQRKAQQASAELVFAEGDPVHLSGDLGLYLSGRDARHIGGEFSAYDDQQMSLSDILFVMQFAGTARQQTASPQLTGR